MWSSPSLQTNIKKTLNWLTQMLRFVVDTQASPPWDFPWYLNLAALALRYQEVYLFHDFLLQGGGLGGRSRKQMVFTSGITSFPSSYTLSAGRYRNKARGHWGFVWRSQLVLSLWRVFAPELSGSVTFAKTELWSTLNLRAPKLPTVSTKPQQGPSTA